MSNKPVSLCLVQMGKSGLELVNSYPQILTDEELNEVVVKSMPLGAKDGDFISSTVGENVLSGYVFSIPGPDRTNVASLVAVFNNMDEFQPKVIKKVFSFTITELKKNNYREMKIYSELLPKIFMGLTSGRIKIKLSSVLTIDMEIESEKTQTKQKDKFDQFGDDVW